LAITKKAYRRLNGNKNPRRTVYEGGTQAKGGAVATPPNHRAARSTEMHSGECQQPNVKEKL